MLKILFSAFVLSLVFDYTGFAQSKVGNFSFILLDGKVLNEVDGKYQKGDTTLKAVNDLIKDADSLMKVGPYSVTFEKTKLAPSNNKHDYVSQAPYWWADSSKTNGKPYIRKDGRRNPEIYLLHDASQMGKMSSSVKRLALAYHFTGKQQYAEKARQLLKVWFIDAETRMNPNLNYAQYIPGINNGRGIGIIETVGLTNIPDAITLLQSSKYFDSALITSIKQWFISYANWLLNSKNGKEERSQINNHGTNYDMQLADFALFINNKQLAVKVIKEFTIPRIDQQFTTDGMQPLELVRTKSWDYSTMNLNAWCRLAIIADKLNMDLWHQQTLDGKGIKGAIAFLLPYALKQKEWTYPEIGKFDYGNMKHIMHAADGKYTEIPFNAFYDQFPANSPLQFLN
ncbi:alginate lyase family protein [Mucilaginibacter agri]|uniref:Alginate lyase domain-containing protein n=1 Tax=Mucilaginibacter agri TaxID=2695265 RepID=A0A965ZKA9_9SPHI|nr:alginate lyase family protein [Mucilaginibacter agri]NCD71211.1 hypothetical protein [Mucilaginibacter agri]